MNFVRKVNVTKIQREVDDSNYFFSVTQPVCFNTIHLFLALKNRLELYTKR